MKRWLLIGGAVLLVLAVVSGIYWLRLRERFRFEELRDPEFVAAAEASFLEDGDRVLGVTGPEGVGSVAKAYPVAVLAWHHIVADELNGRPITVTW